MIDVRLRQLTLLQEQRSAIIHHVVTEGLDPNTTMRASGVEWLGTVPETWTVKRLKYVAICNKRVLSEQTAPDYILDYVDIGNVTSSGEIVNTDCFEFKDAPSRARRVPGPETVIISTVRTYLRAIAFLNHPVDNLVVSTGFAVLEPHKDLRARFLYYVLLSEYFIQRVIAESKGVGYPAISSTELMNIPIAFPKPIAEQDAIVAYIDAETAKIDDLILKYRREVELLSEYGDALISHAVTGKIDFTQMETPLVLEAVQSL